MTYDVTDGGVGDLFLLSWPWWSLNAGKLAIIHLQETGQEYTLLYKVLTSRVRLDLVHASERFPNMKKDKCESFVLSPARHSQIRKWFQGFEIKRCMYYTLDIRIWINIMTSNRFRAQEPKVPVTFCDIALSVVSTSSPEPLDGFWRNLVWMKWSRCIASVVVSRPDLPRGGSKMGQK